MEHIFELVGIFIVLFLVSGSPMRINHNTLSKGEKKKNNV